MRFLKISYYPDEHSGPVKDYMDFLADRRPEAWAKLALDLEVLGAEGLRSGQIVIRSMGQGLWELKRLYDGIQYRVFFCVRKGRAWLLHAIEKKSGKTPSAAVRLARRRMRELA